MCHSGARRGIAVNQRAPTLPPFGDQLRSATGDRTGNKIRPAQLFGQPVAWALHLRMQLEFQSTSLRQAPAGTTHFGPGGVHF